MAGDKIIVPVWTFEAKLEGRPVEGLSPRIMPTGYGRRLPNIKRRIA